MQFLDRIIVACAHGIGRVFLFLSTAWVYLVTLTVLALIGLGLWWIASWIFGKL